MAISLGFISLFDFAKFSGWIATFLLCIIPMEIVMGVTWGMKQPRFAAERSQPVRGILFSLVALITGVVVVLAHWTGVGGGVSPPTPMLTQCMIASVVIMFWMAIMRGGWPFTALIKNPTGAGSYPYGGLLRHQFHPFPHLLQLRFYERRAGLCCGARSTRHAQRLSRVVFYVTAQLGKNQIRIPAQLLVVHSGHLRPARENAFYAAKLLQPERALHLRQSVVVADHGVLSHSPGSPRPWLRSARAMAATSASLVTIMPPSPVVICLLG